MYMLKTKVKVGAITNLTDARYFAAREVSYLGFDFSVGSDSYIAPAQMLAIKDWVDGVQFVGEFNLESSEEIREAISELGLDAVQLGMAAAEETIQALLGEIPIYREIVLDYYHSDEDLVDFFAANPPGITYYVLNLDKNGFTWNDLQTDTAISLKAVKEICEQHPVFLALAYQPNEVHDILKALPLKGLHLIGGEEEKVGLKSFDDLDEIFDLLEIED